MDIRWDSIIGHERVKAGLREMLAAGRLPHALLFYGPEGVGKKRVARALAASILCTGTDAADAPCGECPSCRRMMADADRDYYELVPEREGKATPVILIDRIRREVQPFASRTSEGGLSRVLVIDDAEAMNEPAANSLLKTLEEPAGRVTFILITSMRSALLPTIISRCIPIPFGMLQESEVEAVLRGKGVSEADAHAAATLSGGSAHLAEKLLEKGARAMEESALSLLHDAPTLTMMSVFERAEAVSKEPRETLLEWTGILLLLLRDLLLLSYDGGTPLVVAEDRRGALLSLLGRYGEREIYAAYALVRDTQKRLMTNAAPRLLLEGFLIRLRDVFR